MEENKCVSDVVNTSIDNRNNVREPNRCSSCEQVFGSASELTEHQCVHLNVSFFSCSVCSKSFITKADIKHHVIIHLERSLCLKCSICSTTELVTQHKIVHSEKRPYKFSVWSEIIESYLNV